MHGRILFALLICTVMFSCYKDPVAEDPGPGDPNNNNDTTPAPVELITRVVASNLAFPWDIFYGSDGFIWMTKKGGRISRVNPETGDVVPLLTIDEVRVRGEGGLLGMVMHEANGTSHLYVAYNYGEGDNYKQKIVRYSYENDALSDPTIIHDEVKGAGIHNGCRLVIKDEKLFVTTGDASDQSLPQNFGSRNGKILRLNLDGSIPADNPDPSSAVWSVGHRNPQGLVFVGDSLFSSEHGPATDDEINIIHRGSNYGWPNVHGSCDNDEMAFCNDHSVVEPLMQWTPTIAVCGIEYYTSDNIPQWKNSLLMCTLKDQTLYQLRFNDDQSEIIGTKEFFRDEFGRLRDVCASPEGTVYLCTSNGNEDVLIEVKGKK